LFGEHGKWQMADGCVMRLKAAVLGSPISHSLSPALHHAAYAALGLDIDYTAIETPTQLLAVRIAELNQDFIGYSLTMPLKQEVLSLVAHQSLLVTQTGCANTVYRNAENQWALENTDVFGIQQTITQQGLGRQKLACIIGSGATASSALSALANLGVREVFCYARNQESAVLLRKQSQILGIEFHYVDLGNEVVLSGDLVISTVPGTAASNITEALAVNQNLPPLLDIAYNPWPSELARYWESRGGGPVLSGIEMLLWQASAQVQLFTGLAAPIEAMRAALPKGLSTV
jgi:shikimate dehydrogenase